MTVHVWFMGHDLKSHEELIPDDHMAKICADYSEMTADEVIVQYLKDMGHKVAHLLNIVYEDD